MVSPELLKRVLAEVDLHVRRSKGYETESMINPLTPVDCVAAFAMARLLTEQKRFDYCVAVAPEGHVYGYFFEKCFGAAVLSVHVDYPPRRCLALDDLSVVSGKRVLILEDDVASGTTLRHVVSAIIEYEPQSLDLYLGRPKDAQVLDHIDPAIGTVYLAEDYLDPNLRAVYESQFEGFFLEYLNRCSHVFSHTDYCRHGHHPLWDLLNGVGSGSHCWCSGRGRED